MSACHSQTRNSLHEWIRFTHMSGVKSIPGSVFTGLNFILAVAAVYFVLQRAVVAQTLHAFHWKGLDWIEMDWRGAEWIGLMFIQLRAEVYVSVTWNEMAPHKTNPHFWIMNLSAWLVVKKWTVKEEGVFSPLFAASKKMLSLSIRMWGGFGHYTCLNKGHKKEGCPKIGERKPGLMNLGEVPPLFDITKGASEGAEQEVLRDCHKNASLPTNLQKNTVRTNRSSTRSRKGRGDLWTSGRQLKVTLWGLEAPLCAL